MVKGIEKLWNFNIGDFEVILVILYIVVVWYLRFILNEVLFVGKIFCCRELVIKIVRLFGGERNE